MNKLSKEEKKIISLAGLLVLVTILAIVGVYNPKRKVVRKEKERVEVKEAEVRAIRAMIGEDVTLEEGVEILQERAENLKAKYIRQRNISLALKILSDSANSAGVRIVSTNLQSLNVFTSNQGISPTYNGDVCKRMPVNMVLEGKYEAMGLYLSLLENSPIGIYTIDGFSLLREEEIYPDLSMRLKVSLYCFSPQK